MIKSVKIKSSIQSQLEKIKKDSFVEDDIKLLLINIRESLTTGSLLKELTNFIAHPTRDTGIFNKALNTRYLKYKLIKEQLSKYNVEQQRLTNTESELGDFLLSGIDLNKIDKNIFEILFLDGLSDISSKVFKEYYPLTKKQIDQLIRKSYTLDNSKKFYFIKPYSKVLILEDALKFIMGTIEASVIFDQKTFEKEIITAIEKIVNEYNFDKSYIGYVKCNLKSILLCILCLLHDSKFLFHDKHIATCFLSIYSPQEQFTNDNAGNESYISLVSDDMGINMPIFVSNLKAHEYIFDNEFNDHMQMKRIPWINTIRDKDNKLVLSKEFN